MEDQENLHVFKILFLGQSGVGKSSLVVRIGEDTFTSDFISTIGVDFRIKTMQESNAKVKLQLWDTGGQLRFRNIAVAYAVRTQALCYVFDLTNRESLIAITNWREMAEERLEKATLKFLIGNKADQQQNRKVTTEEGLAFAALNDMQYFQTSAKDNVNVQNMIHSITRKILSTTPNINKALRINKNNQPRTKRIVYTTCF